MANNIEDLRRSAYLYNVRVRELAIRAQLAPFEVSYEIGGLELPGRSEELRFGKLGALMNSIGRKVIPNHWDWTIRGIHGADSIIIFTAYHPECEIIQL